MPHSKLRAATTPIATPGSRYYTVKGSRKIPQRERTASFKAELQRQLKHIKNLYEADKKHRATTKVAYDQSKDQMLAKLEGLDLTELALEGTDFAVQVKERSHWVYSAETTRLKHELEAAQKYEQEIGTAHNDPTSYLSPITRR